MIPPPSHAGDVSGRALASVESFDSGEFSSSGLDQLYELRLQRQITPAFHVRLSGRAEDIGGTNDTTFGERRRDYQELQPGAQVDYTLPGFQLQGTYDLIRTTSSIESGPESDRRWRRAAEHLTWRPWQRLGLTLQSEDRGVRDQPARLDQTETLRQAGLDYGVRSLALAAYARRTRLDDNVAFFTREAQEEQGTLAFAHSSPGGRFNASADLLLSATGLDESAGPEAASVPSPVSIARASYLVDDTPFDSQDHHPVPMIDLTDGNQERAVGIPLGPDASSFQTIVLDLGRYSPIDEIDVVIRDADGKRPLTGGAVTWDAYESPDGLRWTPIAGGSRTAYGAALGEYEVHFRRMTVRYVKVVSFGTNVETTSVTETRAFYHTSLAPGETRHTTFRSASGTTSVSARLHRAVAVTYYGLFNTLQQTGGLSDDLSNTSADHLVSLSVDPWRIVNVIGRYERRTLHADGADQAFDIYSTVAQVAESAGLQQSLEITHAAEDDAGRTSRTQGMTLHTYTRFYRTLDLLLDGGASRQEYPLGPAAAAFRADRTLLGALLQAQMTRSLKLSLGANLQHSRYAGEEPLRDMEGVFLLPRKDDRWTVEIFYGPSAQLALTARLGRATTDSTGVTLQRYHVDWHPFPGGALRLGGLYDLDVDSIGHRQARRLTINPVWTINRRTTLSANYSRLVIAAAPPSSSTAFVTTLSLML